MHIFVLGNLYKKTLIPIIQVKNAIQITNLLSIMKHNNHSFNRLCYNFINYPKRKSFIKFYHSQTLKISCL